LERSAQAKRIAPQIDGMLRGGRIRSTKSSRNIAAVGDIDKVL
jgi:hypothetical protein